MELIIVVLIIFLLGFIAGIIFSFKFLRGLFKFFTK